MRDEIYYIQEDWLIHSCIIVYSGSYKCSYNVYGR